MTNNDETLKVLYGFPQPTMIENIHVRPDGQLLLTTLDSAILYGLNPAQHESQPTQLAFLDGSTGLTGIATIGSDKFAVAGGLHSSFSFTNTSVYIVQLDGQSASILDRIQVDGMINGMVALPSMPHIVLGADSIRGCITRVNTQSRLVDVALHDPVLGRGDSSFPLGINGIDIHQDRLYFTNSALGTFSFLTIDASGSPTSSATTIATLPSMPAHFTNAYDDFAMDQFGNAYVALHSTLCMKITTMGEQSEFLTGLDEPMAAALSIDKATLYISTGGARTKDGPGGRVLELKLA